MYYFLGMDQICSGISDKYKFTYDLNSVLSRLLYGRILFPSSKLNTFEESKALLEQPGFDLQHIYRALDVICEEDSFIQSGLYKNSKTVSKRNDRVLFYDCTNFFFEIEQEDGLRQYGPSKERRPDPIVEMGLFMDGDGIPLAFSIHPGNKGEQQTLIPLEEQIIKDFRNMNFLAANGEGYIPTYTRTDLTDALHEAFGFRTDCDIVTEKQMKKIFRDTKKAKKVCKIFRL